MKLILIAIVFFYLNCSAQDIIPNNSLIQSYKLEVTCNKTTSLIFPAPIISVDRGSQDIVVQKAKGVENILRVKAGAEDFTETSLCIITADGKLYSFIVRYAAEPSYLNIDVGRITSQDPATIIYSDPAIDKTSLTVYADSVLFKEPKLRTIHAGTSGIFFALNAIYIHDDVLFFRVELQNNSAINYDIDQLHFYVRDKKLNKRTASQETELCPLLIKGGTVKLRAETKMQWVIAIPKFTIPDGKYFSIEMMEKNGGRNLLLKVKSRNIMKAQIL